MAETHDDNNKAVIAKLALLQAGRQNADAIEKPSDEELAAFIDGTLPENKREKVLTALANDDSLRQAWLAAAQPALDVAPAKQGFFSALSEQIAGMFNNTAANVAMGALAATVLVMVMVPGQVDLDTTSPIQGGWGEGRTAFAPTDIAEDYNNDTMLTMQGIYKRFADADFSDPLLDGNPAVSFELSKEEVKTDAYLAGKLIASNRILCASPEANSAELENNLLSLQIIQKDLAGFSWYDEALDQPLESAADTCAWTAKILSHLSK